jgi:hypothetical protein
MTPPPRGVGVRLRVFLSGWLAGWLAGCLSACLPVCVGATFAARAVTVEEVLRKVCVAAEEPRARRAGAVIPRCAHLRGGVDKG